MPISTVWGLIQHTQWLDSSMIWARIWSLAFSCPYSMNTESLVWYDWFIVGPDKNLLLLKLFVSVFFFFLLSTDARFLLLCQAWLSSEAWDLIAGLVSVTSKQLCSEGLGSARCQCLKRLPVMGWFHLVSLVFECFRSGVLSAQEHLVVESVRRYLELPRSTATHSDVEPKSLGQTHIQHRHA